MRIETADIFDDLQRKLVTAAFQPGVKLKPTALQGHYGCSANTVRDVLLRLTTVGLVEFEMQRGFRTRDTTPERRHDVTKFRILLEQEGAASSMTNGGVEWQARLAAAHHKLSHIETRIALVDDVQPHMDLWSDAELEFHETLISSCRSPLLRETYSNVYLQFRQQMVSLERDFGTNYFRAIIAEHLAILDAALAGDIDACKTAVFDHLKRNL